MQVTEPKNNYYESTGQSPSKCDRIVLSRLPGMHQDTSSNEGSAYHMNNAATLKRSVETCSVNSSINNFPLDPSHVETQ